MKTRYLLLAALALVPMPAAADPVSLITLAATFALDATVAAIVVSAAAIYSSVDARRKARREAARARAAYNASLSDRTVTVLQADPSHRVVYGRCVTGGAIVAMFTSDKQGTRTNGDAYTKPDGLRHMVIVFASHQCQALNEVFVDGVAVGIGALDGNGWATSGEFGGDRQVHREVVVAAGASVTFPAPVTVQTFVEYLPAEQAQDGVYTLSNGDKTITNNSAFQCAASVTYSEGAGSVRVSWALGTDTQPADAYLRSVVPSQWLATDQLLGRAYVVLTLDLENTRFQGGPPGVTFDVSGRLVYDPRANALPNPRFEGAVEGTPGTVPTGMVVNVPAGTAGSVVDRGIDLATGRHYLDLRMAGTPSAAGTWVINFAGVASAPAAAAGQAWSTRMGLTLRSATAAHPLIRLQLLSYDAGGGNTAEATGAAIPLVAGGPMQMVTLTDPAYGATAVKATVRLQLTVTAGLDYDSTVRILFPQLWQGVLAGAGDPVAWRDNSALIVADWLMASWGYDVTADDIDDADLVVAANACDAQIEFAVQGQPSQWGPTYTANGSFTTDESRDGVLDALCQSMAGDAVPGPTWSIQAGAWTPPVLTLTDADLHGQVEIVQAGAPMGELFNGIRGSYLPMGGTAPVDSLYANQVFRTADGQELWVDMSFPWTNTAPRVRNLQRVLVERNRAGLVARYPAKLVAWPVKVGDRLTLFNAEYGWSGKTFRVTDWAFSATQAVMLTIQEDAASVWDQADAATPDPTPNTNLPNPWKVAAITGATATSGDTQLQVLEDGTLNIRCRIAWTAVTDPYVVSGGSIEVAWRRVGIDPANQWTLIASPGDASAEMIGGLVDGHTLAIAITAVNSLGARGQTAYLTHKVIGKRLPPSDVQSIGFAVERYGVRLYWPPVTDRDVVGYPLRINGTSWETATPVTQVPGGEYLLGVTDEGSFPVWVKAIDTGGRMSANAATQVVTIDAPAAPVVSFQVLGTDEELSWTFVAGNFALDHFDVRMGATWETASLVTSTRSTSYRRRVTYGGARRYWVAAVDAAGTTGTPTSIDVLIQPPGPITSGRSEVIDNNALLYWSPPLTGSLPIDRYEARKGATWAAGTPIGSNGNSNFMAIFEQQSGTYSYWIAAFDSAGNMGTPVAIVALINQPPDYVLRVNIDSSFAGTLDSMVLDGGSLVGPVDTTETWASHFSSRAWASPADQVAAGYALYLEPSKTSGSYTEVFDYGAVLSTTTVTATLGYTVLDGAVTVACQIYYKTLAGDPWTAAAAGATSVLLSNFRYVRVVWTFTCTAGANLIKVTSFNLKLANKLRTDSGTFTITNAATGVWVPFAVSFVDADTPSCQAAGMTPLKEVVDFADVPNPTGFTVYLFNLSGAKVTGSGSWTARGY